MRTKLCKAITALICRVLSIPLFKCEHCQHEGDEPLYYGANGTYVKSCPKCFHEQPVTIKFKKSVLG